MGAKLIHGDEGDKPDLLVPNPSATEIKGSSEILKKGEPPKVTDEVLGSVASTTPMANVGLTYSRSINMGNYESVKVAVSIHMPSEPDEENINQAFMFCDVWASQKMKDITDAVEESKNG